MVRRVILSQDIPSVEADIKARAAAQQNDTIRRELFQSKTFEELSPADKDRLLKSVAVGMGLIQDSIDP